MRVGFTSTCAVGLALALTIGYATTSQAQQDSTRSTRRRTTRSSQRIPITKERSTSRGEVTPPPAPTPNQDSIAAAERARQDSIAAAERSRQDSIARADQMRRDSVAAVERRRADSIAAVERARQDSIARADSLAAAEAARMRLMRWAGGAYIGVGGGISLPMGDVKNATAASSGYSSGWNVTVPFGWDFTGNPFGIRFDVGYDRWKGNHYTTSGGQAIDAPDASIISGNADVKLRVPLGRSWSRFYVLGGVGANRVTGFTPYNSTSGQMTFGNAKTNFGWNAGGGFTFAWGRTGLFLESRYMSASTTAQSGFDVASAKWVPVILGIQF